MNDKDTINLLILSDLHCSLNDDKATRLLSNLPANPVSQNPVASFLKFVKSPANSISADIIICPGDITDKADKQGLITGWAYLREIKSHFQCPLVTTIGNHDVDSRNSYATNKPFEFLKSLHDEYPFNDDTCKDEFWNKGYTIIEYDDCQLLIINSAYDHTNKDFAAKSNIAELALDGIEQALAQLAPGKVRIAVSHHHPINHSNKDYEDTDIMDRGDRLLTILSQFKFNLYIHGHKHTPRLKIVDRLPILCAGSFSSWMNLKESGAENVFHLIELSKSSKRGIIRTYVFITNEGWMAKKNRFFPLRTGFGFSPNDEWICSVGSWCEEKIKAEKFVFFSEVCQTFPDILYLAPIDQQLVHSELEEKFFLQFDSALHDIPKVILPAN